MVNKDRCLEDEELFVGLVGDSHRRAHRGGHGVAAGIRKGHGFVLEAVGFGRGDRGQVCDREVVIEAAEEAEGPELGVRGRGRRVVEGVLEAARLALAVPEDHRLHRLGVREGAARFELDQRVVAACRALRDRAAGGTKKTCKSLNRSHAFTVI